VAVSSGGKFVSLWDWTSGRKLHEFADGPLVGLLIFAQDGKSLYYPSYGRFLERDVMTGRELRQFGECELYGCQSLAMSPDGALLVAEDSNHGLRFWEVKRGTELRRGERQRVRLNSLAFSPDSKRLAAAQGVRIQLFDVTTGKDVPDRHGHHS